MSGWSVRAGTAIGVGEGLGCGSRSLCGRLSEVSRFGAGRGADGFRAEEEHQVGGSRHLDEYEEVLGVGVSAAQLMVPALERAALVGTALAGRA